MSAEIRWRGPIPLFASLRIEAAYDGRRGDHRLYVDNVLAVQEVEHWGEPALTAAPALVSAATYQRRTLRAADILAFASITLDLDPRYHDRAWRGQLGARWAPPMLLAILAMESIWCEHPERQPTRLSYQLHTPALENEPITIGVAGPASRLHISIDGTNRRIMTATLDSVI